MYGSLPLGVYPREVAKCPLKIDWLIPLFDFELLCSSICCSYHLVLYPRQGLTRKTAFASKRFI